MTEFIPLTERIRQDNIRISVATQDKNVGTWSILLASDLNAMEMAVPYVQAVSEIGETPRVEDVFYCVLMDVSGYVHNSFIEFGREFYAYDTLTWDHVAEAMKAYADIGEQCKLLREFLGAKFDAYIHETEFDV